MQARVITALITPFDAEGEVDFASLETLIQWQIEKEMEGLVLCGSTGEGSSLTKGEKLAIFQKAIEVGKGEIELIANIGSSSTKESLDLAQEAKNLGMDACMAVIPYYIKPTEEGCFLHFSAIAKLGLPLVVYHHPGRTGMKLSVGSLLRIMQIPGVCGLKEASGDLELIQELIDRKIPLFSGDDLDCETHLRLGAKGSISVTANAFPRLWKEMVDRQKMGPDLLKFCQALFLETNPQGIKYAVSLLKRCQAHYRLPLLLPRQQSREKIKEALQTVE